MSECDHDIQQNDCDGDRIPWCLKCGWYPTTEQLIDELARLKQKLAAKDKLVGKIADDLDPHLRVYDAHCGVFLRDGLTGRRLAKDLDEARRAIGGGK